MVPKVPVELKRLVAEAEVPKAPLQPPRTVRRPAATTGESSQPPRAPCSS